MAVIDDTKTVINILRGGGTATTPQLLRIANRFRVVAGDGFIAVDPENPTNDELAQNVLWVLRRFGQRILKGQGESEARSDNEAVVDAAGATAEGDL